jgi:predicted porin
MSCVGSTSAFNEVGCAKSTRELDAAGTSADSLSLHGLAVRLSPISDPDPRACGRARVGISTALLTNSRDTSHMKRTTKGALLTLAMLGALTHVASAQSNITISGGIDMGVARDFVGGTSNKVVQSAGRSARSNLTFSGREDLGNGMYAMFLLNHRFNPDTGTVNPGANNSTPSQFWRQSMVELGGGFGAVRMGRWLTPFQEYNGVFDAFGTDTVGSVHVNALLNRGNVRVNSMVEYRTPTIGGFSGMLGAGESEEQGVAVPKTRPAGAGLRYREGALDVAVAWDRTAADVKTSAMYASYAFGWGKVLGQFETADPVVIGNNKSKVWSLSTKVPFGLVDFKAGYASLKAETSSSDKKKIGIGADYNLSKRTQLYVGFGKVSGGSAVSDQEKKARYDLGIYHRF